MLYVLSFALMDTVNFLLIGVLVAVGVAQPLRDKGGRYGPVAGLLVFGDWLGVLLLALLTMVVFDGLGEKIETLVESPVFGVLLILTGVASAVLAWRGGGDGSSGLVRRIMRPLKTPSWATVGTGVVLGLVQSVTSVPFFAGIAVMSAGDFATVTRYVGMIAYASVALSLPFLCALVVGYIRMRPYSAVGRGFGWMRQNQGTVARAGGYIVALFLILLGVIHLV
ncbi:MULTISPECIES: GAP family protein [unclassified Corynebacterium]|uniref:GAP family protein n=1 Tax=unclassified Corynebacterium TaxID=2624378 RepID=UPI0030B595D6